MKNYIGNDIVDLTTNDALTYPTNSRFVNRVLSKEEQIFFFNHANDIKIFWLHWSAKEAVYKIIKKIEPKTFFSYHAYVLTLQEVTSESAYGFVTYQDDKYPVAFSISTVLIHCVAAPMKAKGHLVSEVKAHDKISTLDISFSPRELSSIHSSESFLVRCLVKNMLKDVTGMDYEIYRRPLLQKFGPPEVWMSGMKCETLDISMSHDGNFCAGLILFDH